MTGMCVGDSFVGCVIVSVCMSVLLVCLCNRSVCVTGVCVCVYPMDCGVPVFFVLSRHESWRGFPFLFLGISHMGSQPRSPTLQVDSLLQEAKFSLSTEHCR